MLTEVSIAVGHTLLASAACLLLWKIWHRFASGDATVGMIVGAGLVVRSIGSQALFWVSFLNLPVARALQDGGGFWKFSVDSELYFGDSSAMLAKGWRAVVLVDRTLPSPAYLQSLSVFLLLFGIVASVGALLNLFAYLAGCAAILRIGGSEGHSRRATLIALAALALSPSLVLWSTQPLKDAFFISSVAIFVAACSAWRKAWLNQKPPLTACLISLLGVLAALYAVVGARWYFGVLVCAVTVPFLIAVVFGSRRRILAGLGNAALLVLMVRVMVFVSGPYFPAPLARLLAPSVRFHDISRSSHDLALLVSQSRTGFDQTSANSQIRLGSAMTNIDPEGTGKAASAITEPAAPEAISALPIGTATETSGTVTATHITPQPPPAILQPSSSDTPQSVFMRVFAGLVAVVVPRFASQALGIISIAGGAGMWPVVETDTLLFDALLLVALSYVARGIRAGALREPVFWLVSLITGGITVLLTYTISNFGTLFRHRSMILMGLCLLLVVTRTPSPAAVITPEEES